MKTIPASIGALFIVACEAFATADPLTDAARAWDAAGAPSAVWAWASAPPCECNASRADCPCATSKAQYDRLRDRAIAENKPLIVFVKAEPRAIAGCLICRWDEFPDLASPAVVVGVPADKELRRVAVLPANCTGDAIRAALTCPDGKCRITPARPW